MPFVQSLNHNNSYTVDGTATSGTVAVTILTIKTSGAVSAVTLVNPTGSSQSIGNGIARIIFLVHGTAGGNGTFTITQSGTQMINTTWGSTSPEELTYACAVT